MVNADIETRLSLGEELKSMNSHMRCEKRTMSDIHTRQQRIWLLTNSLLSKSIIQRYSNFAICLERQVHHLPVCQLIASQS